MLINPLNTALGLLQHFVLSHAGWL